MIEDKSVSVECEIQWKLHGSVLGTASRNHWHWPDFSQIDQIYPFSTEISSFLKQYLAKSDEYNLDRFSRS